MAADGEGFTLKDMLIRIDAKVDRIEAGLNQKVDRTEFNTLQKQIATLEMWFQSPEHREVLNRITAIEAKQVAYDAREPGMIKEGQQYVKEFRDSQRDITEHDKRLNALENSLAAAKDAEKSAKDNKRWIFGAIILIIGNIGYTTFSILNAVRQVHPGG